MGEVKHTTGGWARNIKPATKYNCIYAGRNTPVAYLATDLPHDEVEANCSLIAAAPDMLVALKAIVDLQGKAAGGFPLSEDENRAWALANHNARAAIAAAEGR